MGSMNVKTVKVMISTDDGRALDEFMIAMKDDGTFTIEGLAKSIREVVAFAFHIVEDKARKSA